MNDLLEQLVGDLENELTAPDDASKINRTSENEWVIDGSAQLRDVARDLGVTLPEEEYDTFGGMVFGTYGKIPEDGCIVHNKTTQNCKRKSPLLQS